MVWEPAHGNTEEKNFARIYSLADLQANGRLETLVRARLREEGRLMTESTYVNDVIGQEDKFDGRQG